MSLHVTFLPQHPSQVSRVSVLDMYLQWHCLPVLVKCEILRIWNSRLLGNGHSLTHRIYVVDRKKNAGLKRNGNLGEVSEEVL